MRNIGIAVGLALLVAGCGKPDASGIYVRTTDNQVSLIQLIQTEDGKVTGRAEDSTIGADGQVTSKTASLDGAASKSDLMFKPVSAWFGGVTATGKITGKTLSIVTSDGSFEAEKSDLPAYQAALAKLQTKAAGRRQQIAEAKAKAQAAADLQQQMAVAEKREAAFSEGIAAVRAAAGQIAEAAKAVHDYAGDAKANTSQIEQLSQRSGTPVQRNGYTVEANGLINQTRNVALAFQNDTRQLKQTADEARAAGAIMAKFCATPDGAGFPKQCADVASANADFEKAAKAASDAFNGQQRGLSAEFDRQNAIVERMRG